MARGRQGVTLALHQAVLNLCHASGIGSADLIESYNLFRADVAGEAPGRADSAAQLKALLALLIAEGFVGDAGECGLR